MQIQTDAISSSHESYTQDPNKTEGPNLMVRAFDIPCLKIRLLRLSYLREVPGTCAYRQRMEALLLGLYMNLAVATLRDRLR
jgi:hypothetical protein